MYGKYFTYNGESSEDYGLIIGGLTSNTRSDIPLGLSREVLSGTINRWKYRVNTLGTTWSDVLTFDIDCIKDYCADQSLESGIMTEDELNEITAWLTSSDYPLLFHMYDYDFKRDAEHQTLLVTNPDSEMNNATYVVYHDSQTDVITVNFSNKTAECEGRNLGFSQNEYYFVITASDEIDAKWLSSITALYLEGLEYTNTHTDSWITDIKTRKITNAFMCGGQYDRFLNRQYDYYGLFTDIKPQTIGDNIVGLTLTFTTNSPFAYSPIYSVSLLGTGVFSVESNSAERMREVYPVIEIYDSSVSSSPYFVTIQNITDNERFLTVNIRSRDLMTINCEKATIRDSSGKLMGFDDLGIDEIGEIYWPRLLYGVNTLQILAPSTTTVTLYWREPRKVGAY